jgi:plasmid stabilization system protein ParE
VRIDYHPEAIAELNDATDWYLARSPRSAARFVDNVDAALNKINADPLRFPVIESQFRACSVERFPYQIIYRVDPDRLFIMAIAHAKRRPGYWRNR